MAFGEDQRRARLMTASQWSTGAALRDWQATPTFSSDDIAADLAEVLRRLRNRGLDRAIWVDLTKPDLNLPVARVIVPGLEAPHNVNAEPGKRARTARDEALMIARRA